MTFAELRVDVVILACAISAGVHAALVPAHFREGVAPGAGFVAATLALGAAAVVLTMHPSPLALSASGAIFAGLIVSYVLAVTTGLPVLHPDVEPVDALAVCTKAIEAIGLVAAAVGLRPSAALPFASQERAAA